MSKAALILGPMRPPFLILAPACTLAGISVAFWRTDGQINWWYAVLCILGAVAAHISVNALNEYFDFKSGLDGKTQRTPFSGGSGTLPANPQAAGYALTTGIIGLALVAAIGIFFTFQRGWQILPLGLLGMLVIYIYTFWLLKVPPSQPDQPRSGLWDAGSHGYRFRADRFLFICRIPGLPCPILPGQQSAIAQPVPGCGSR